MRATTRITWLLLSLSCVCSNVDGQMAPSVTKNDTSVTPAPSAVPTNGSASVNGSTTDSNTSVNVVGTTGAPTTSDTGNKSVANPAPTSAKPPTTTPAIAVAVTSKPTDKLTTTQPQTSSVANSLPAALPSSVSGAQTTVKTDVTTATTATTATTPSAAPAAAASSSLTNATTPAATNASSGGSVVSLNASTPQTPVTSLPSKTTGTAAPVGTAAPAGTAAPVRTAAPAGLPGNATTEIANVSTGASTPGKQSPTQTTSKAGTKATTVTTTSQKQTSSRSPAGTTRTPSTTTKTGPRATESSGTKAGTTSPKTTTTTTTIIVTASTAAQPNTFLYSLNKGHEEKDEKDLVEVCKRLMVNLQDGNCTLTWQHHNGKLVFDCVEINGKVKTSLANQYYEDITKKPTDNKTLIAILASCGALLIMIVILAVCASHHRKPFNENQQHLTEELHTVENGYHDNPTLEVMEVQPEMQEKKMMALNGEFNDSWIVPIDNLLKEDIADEEDTHL